MVFVDIESEDLLLRVVPLQLVLNGDQLRKLFGVKLRWSKGAHTAVLLGQLEIGGAILADRLLGDDADNGALSLQPAYCRVNSRPFAQLFGLPRRALYLPLHQAHFFTDKLFVPHDLVYQLRIILLFDLGEIKLLDFRQIVIITLYLTPSGHWFKHQNWILRLWFLQQLFHTILLFLVSTAQGLRWWCERRVKVFPLGL